MDRINSITLLLEKNPEDVFLHYALAMEYLSHEKKEAAIEKMEWIRKHFPSYLPLYYQLAKVYENTGAMVSAIQIYEEGIQIAAEQKEKKTELELKSALEEILY